MSCCTPPPIVKPEGQDKYGLKHFMAEFLERMRDVCRQEKYNVREMFSQHDPLEFGTTSDMIFKCVMHENFMCQTGFTLDVIQTIADFFRMPDGSICYMRLHGLMDSDRNITDQLRECASKVPFPRISDAPLRVCGKRVFATDPCIPALLERIRTAYSRLKCKLNDFFRCCDPRGTGLVSEDKFQCILNDTIVPEAGLTERQLEAITNYYRARENMIDYKRMNDMFESVLSIQEQIQSDYPTTRPDPEMFRVVNKLSCDDEDKVKEILFKICKTANRNRLKTFNAIMDKFSYQLSGETSVTHLRRFIFYMEGTILESEFDLLCKKYATNDHSINFVQLIADLDDVFHDKMCPKKPVCPILGADGPPYDMDFVEIVDGGGKHSSAWGFPNCCCATPEEARKSACLAPDSTRFYEGGPVVGGDGRKPVFGRAYVKKREKARAGQGYAGDYACTRPAGIISSLPVGLVHEIGIVPRASEKVNLRSLMERLQQYLYRFRIRAKYFFQHFDPLNTGTITANRFRRALYNMGVGAIGNLQITEAEHDALINFYRLDHDPDMACWRKFDADIESIFLQRGIEKYPTILTPSPCSILTIPEPGQISMEDVPLRVRQIAKCAVARLRHRVLIESCNIKYFFQGFDPVNNGYITRLQFKQTLGMLNYGFTAEELEAMSVQYCDVKGFNYLRLMADIEPKKADPEWYAKYKSGRLSQLNKPPPDPKWTEHDIQRIMYKIQARTSRRRPKVKMFLQDHDRFNHDRIKILDFHRALDRAGFELTPREVEVLTCCFRSPDDHCEIEWRCFCNTIEQVFTLEQLERGPRIVPKEWRPMREKDFDKEFCEGEVCFLKEGLRKFSRRSHNNRLEIRRCFADYDLPKNGLVSVDQFHRVLHFLKLDNITTNCEMDAILKRFRVVRGGRRDFDYLGFLDEIEGIVSIDPITLEELSPTGQEWYRQAPACIEKPKSDPRKICLS